MQEGNAARDHAAVFKGASRGCVYQPERFGLDPGAAGAGITCLGRKRAKDDAIPARSGRETPRRRGWMPAPHGCTPAEGWGELRESKWERNKHLNSVSVKKQKQKIKKLKQKNELGEKKNKPTS